MKNLLISKCLFLLCLSLAAQEPETPQPTPSDQAEMSRFNAEADRLGEELGNIIGSLRAFQPERARRQIDSVEFPDSLKNLLIGWTYHQQGDYNRALTYLNQAKPEELGGETYFTNRLQEFTKTAEALKDFEVLETENFSIRYQNGPDRVMLFFLPQILEEIYVNYATLFNYQRGDKIIVELMPDHELFSYASALTRQQIETTGTIALCVENRLVVLSPRRVLQGYYWPDVIAHEYVHYILSKQSDDNVPLWMHEGMAKYFEARWEREDSPLDPGMESSIARAVAADSLISVEDMKPSFAALPTPELAQQAYAQTTTMIGYLVEKGGESLVRSIVTSLRDTPDLDIVFKDKIGKDFDGFESDWRDWLKRQDYREHHNHGRQSVTLTDSDTPEEKLTEIGGDDQVRKKHIRLGDLLLERNRYLAALRQYDKVIDPNRPMDRQILLRMIRCYQQLGRHQDIIGVIDRNISDLDSDVTMMLYKADAALGQDQAVQARTFVERAIRINPFHPDIYRLLMILEKEEGDLEGVERVNQMIEALRTRAGETQPPKDSKS